MRKQLRYILFLFIVVIAAAQTALADPVAVDLAERTPPGYPGDPTMTVTGPPPTTTTTTTTTTLPTIPRCPNSIPVRKQVRRTDTTTGALTTKMFAILTMVIGVHISIYCFENPQVDVSSSDRVDWKDITADFGNDWWVKDTLWQDFAAEVTGAAAKHQDDLLHLRLFPRRRLLRTGGEDRDGGRLAPQHRRRSCR